jgi:pilus assembly protein CpaE
VVANKVQASGGEISRADFEASIERKINFAMPYDFKGATHAAKLGQTFAEANRTGKAGAVLREVARTLRAVCDPAAGDDKAAATASRCWARSTSRRC